VRHRDNTLESQALRTEGPRPPSEVLEKGILKIVLTSESVQDSVFRPVFRWLIITGFEKTTSFINISPSALMVVYLMKRKSIPC